MLFRKMSIVSFDTVDIYDMFYPITEYNNKQDHSRHKHNDAEVGYGNKKSTVSLQNDKTRTPITIPRQQDQTGIPKSDNSTEWCKETRSTGNSIQRLSNLKRNNFTTLQRKDVKGCDIHIPDAIAQQRILNSTYVRFLILILICSEALSSTTKYELTSDNCQCFRKGPRLPLRTFYLLLFMNVCYAIEDKDESVRVGLVNPPLEMGQRAELKCIIRLKSRPTVRSWTKIPHGETIAYQNITFNTSKYSLSIEYQHNVIKYNLLILDFGLTDLNFRYKCDADFHSDSVILGLNTGDFLAIPKSNDVYKNVSISDGILAGSIQVQTIYPKPRCTATFAGTNITSGLNIEHTGTYMVLDLHENIDNCDGYLKVICEIGELSYPFSINEYISGCAVAENTWTFPAYTIVIVAVAVFFMTLIILFIKLKYCRSSTIFCSQSADVELYSVRNSLREPSIQRFNTSLKAEIRMIENNLSPDKRPTKKYVDDHTTHMLCGKQEEFNNLTGYPFY